MTTGSKSNQPYEMSRTRKFHFGYFFFIAAATSDSVGGFLLTVTVTVVVEFRLSPPVDEYLIFTVAVATPLSLNLRVAASLLERLQ